MATSVLDIINSALIKIGENEITDPLEASDPADKTRALYPILRDKLLRMYRWNFAMDREELAADATQPKFGFRNQFTIPANVVRVVGLYDEFQPKQNYTTNDEPWKVERGKILTDLDAPLRVFVIRRITTVAEMDATFTEALAWLLALNVAYVLSLGSDLVKNAQTGLEKAMNDARLSDAIEGWPERQVVSEWVDSRYLNGTFGGALGNGPRRFP